MPNLIFQKKKYIQERSGNPTLNLQYTVETHIIVVTRIIEARLSVIGQP